MKLVTIHRTQSNDATCGYAKTALKRKQLKRQTSKMIRQLLKKEESV